MAFAADALAKCPHSESWRPARVLHALPLCSLSHQLAGVRSNSQQQCGNPHKFVAHSHNTLGEFRARFYDDYGLRLARSVCARTGPSTIYLAHSLFWSGSACVRGINKHPNARHFPKVSALAVPHAADWSPKVAGKRWAGDGWRCAQNWPTSSSEVPVAPVAQQITAL